MKPTWLQPTKNPEGEVLYLLLDHPSKLNWAKRQFLWGDEKSLVLRTLQAVGWDGGIRVGYSVPFFVEKKATPSQMAEQRDRVLEDIVASKATKLLTLGPEARALIQGDFEWKNITEFRGRGDWTHLPNGARVFTVISMPPYYVMGDTELYRDFGRDVQKIVQQSEPQSEPQVELTIARSIDQVEEWLRTTITLGASSLSCDIETTGFDPDGDKILAIGIGALYSSDHGRSLIIPVELIPNLGEGHLFPGIRLWKLLYSLLQGVEFDSLPAFSGRVAFHNAKFDMRFLLRRFREIDPSASTTPLNIVDTMLMNYMLDERPINSPHKPHGLKALARVRYDAPNYKFTHDFSSFLLLPPDDSAFQELYTYLGQDLVYTAKLSFDLQQEMLEEDPDLLKCYTQIVNRALKAFVDIELWGTPIDVEYFKAQVPAIQAQLDALKEKMVRVIQTVGGPEWEEFGREFNPNAYQQVQKAVYELFQLGKIRVLTDEENWAPGPTDKETLQAIIAAHPGTAVAELIQAIIEFRMLSKALSTYIQSPIENVDSRGVLHTEFNVNGTSTGRLSSSNPNLQNQPVLMGPIIRRGFIAPPGYLFWCADYKQIELKVAGILSEDPTIYQAYRDGRDIHTEVAAAAFGVPYEEVTYEQRYAAKYIDFGVIYGRSAQGLVTGSELIEFGWSLEQGQAFIDRFLGQFEGLKKWIENQHQFVRKHQYVKTLSGRRRRWSMITPKSLGHIYRQAVNTPIQGLASDFTMTALVEIHEWAKQFDGRITCTVHDEIDGIIRIDQAQEFLQGVVQLMKTKHPIDVKGMPITVDLEVGPNWGDLHAWDPTTPLPNEWLEWWYHPESESWLQTVVGSYRNTDDRLGPYSVEEYLEHKDNVEKPRT